MAEIPLDGNVTERIDARMKTESLLNNWILKQIKRDKKSSL
jgi:hypothetical protein